MTNYKKRVRIQRRKKLDHFEEEGPDVKKEINDHSIGEGLVVTKK